MIAAIESALLASPAGTVSIRYADGRSISYDRRQALAELTYWQQQASNQAGSGLQMQRIAFKGDA
jgi:hypothetical protein